MVEYVVSLDKLGKHDVEHVGGKNASLGEMISNLAGAGVSVPGGFATVADAATVASMSLAGVAGSMGGLQCSPSNF